MDFENKLIHQCVLFWVLNDHHNCLYDSAKNLISAKPGSQVVFKNVFAQSVCRTF